MIKRGARSGFSVLEALVALAIVAIALVPLLSLQTQITRGLGRQHAVHAEATATNNALELLSDMNPAATPQGTLPHGGAGRIAWTSRPLTPEARTNRLGGGEGAFLVRLYRVDVEITGENGVSVSAFAVDKLGWVRLLE